MNLAPRCTLVILLALSALAGLAGCRPTAPVVAVGPPSTVPPTLKTVTVAPAATVPGQAGDIPRITVDELWQRLQGGEAIVVVDARGLDEYRLQHIASSISMPEAEVTKRAGELPQDSLLVFYCT